MRHHQVLWVGGPVILAELAQQRRFPAARCARQAQITIPTRAFGVVPEFIPDRLAAAQHEALDAFLDERLHRCVLFGELVRFLPRRRAELLVNALLEIRVNPVAKLLQPDQPSGLVIPLRPVDERLETGPGDSGLEFGQGDSTVAAGRLAKLSRCNLDHRRGG